MTFLKAYSGNVIPRDQLHLEDGVTIAVSPSGQGILRYNDTTKTFQVSIDGDPYVDLGGSGGAGVGMGGIFANLGAGTPLAAPAVDYVLGAAKSATEADGGFLIPADGNLSNLFALPFANSMDDVTLVTVRVASAGTPLAVSVPAGGVVLVSDTATVVPVSAGDLVSIELDSSASTLGGTIRGFAIGLQYSV